MAACTTSWFRQAYALATLAIESATAVPCLDLLENLRFVGGPAADWFAYLPCPLQEIKTAKLQHKLLHKSVVELQRNGSAQYAELGADLASLAARLARLPAEAHLTEEQLAVRVDALVRAHLLHVSGQMMALQAALASSGAAEGDGAAGC